MNKTNRNNIIFSLITLLILVLIPAYITGTVGKTVTNFQKSIFEKDGSLLFSFSIGFWPFLMYGSIYMFFFFLLSSAYFSLLDTSRLSFIKNSLSDKFSSSIEKSSWGSSIIKFFLKFSVIIFVVMLLSFPSYCVITSETIYFRDLRTGYREVQYNLSDISQVNITYHISPDGDNELKYSISIGNFSINLMNSGFYYDGDIFKRLNKIHTLIEADNIPVHIDIKDIDYQNKEKLRRILE